jgi:hypothetical protein
MTTSIRRQLSTQYERRKTLDERLVRDQRGRKSTAGAAVL